MAFYSGSKSNQNLVFGDNGEIGNLVFAYNNASIASTENKITADLQDYNSQFGTSVAIGNDRIVMGAIGDGNTGAAYIYNLDGTNEIKITASDGAASDNFGISVAIGNDRIVVGAYSHDIGGDNNVGAAYIYGLDGTQLTKITASDGAASDEFGRSVAIGSNKIVVGAPGDDDNGSTSGSAYIYDLDGTNEIKITPSDGAVDDYFGGSVAIGNNRIVVGAYRNDDNGSNSGSAYIFDLYGNQLAKITALDGTTGAYFGFSVAVGSGRIVVGSFGDNGNTGVVYVFDLYGNQLAKITASDGATNDHFGASVAVRSNKIVVGARFDDEQVGSAYIYDLDGSNEIKITASDEFSSSDRFGTSVAIGYGRIVVGAPLDNGAMTSSGAAYIYNTNEYYEDYVEKTLELIG